VVHEPPFYGFACKTPIIRTCVTLFAGLLKDDGDDNGKPLHAQKKYAA
jgi:hypothetical protein